MKFVLGTAMALTLFAGPVFAESFMGYECSSDCSGHRAGYNWARERSLSGPAQCPLVGRRRSFYEGCLAFVQEAPATQAAPQKPAKAAAEPKIKVIVSIPGSCTRFTINNAPETCSSVMYLHFPSGRSSFLVAHKNGTLAFSGGKDSQLVPTRYVLEVDAIRVTSGGADVQSYDATGRCTMESSVSGDYVHKVMCAASNGTERVSLDFHGNGSKVSIQRFD